MDYPDLDEYNDVGSNLVRDSDAGYSNRISLRMLFKKRQTNSGELKFLVDMFNVSGNLITSLQDYWITGGPYSEQVLMYGHGRPLL